MTPRAANPIGEQQLSRAISLIDYALRLGVPHRTVAIALATAQATLVALHDAPVPILIAASKAARLLQGLGESYVEALIDRDDLVALASCIAEDLRDHLVAPEAARA